MINKKNPKPIEKAESIFDQEHRLRKEAKELALNHKDIKPIKYILKK